MGLIALVGGDEFRPDCVPMDEALLRMSQRESPRVLILPTAAAHQGPRLAAENGMRYFAALGAHTHAAMLLTRADAEGADLAGQLAPTDILYLTGGDPTHLLATLAGSPAWEAITAFSARGGIVAGSSAGAMVLGGWMRQVHGPSGWVPALALAPQVAVLPHHDHTALITNLAPLRSGLDPRIAILGIPTATACVSEDGVAWQVHGARPVTLYQEHGATAFLPGSGFRLP